MSTLPAAAVHVPAAATARRFAGPDDAIRPRRGPASTFQRNKCCFMDLLARLAIAYQMITFLDMSGS